jgi:hypothetical protein
MDALQSGVRGNLLPPLLTARLLDHSLVCRNESMGLVLGTLVGREGDQFIEAGVVGRAFGLSLTARHSRRSMDKISECGYAWDATLMRRN